MDIKKNKSRSLNKFVKTPAYLTIGQLVLATFPSVAQSIYTPYNFIYVAGNGSVGSADGPGFAAQFNDPLAIAVDVTGNIYVADHGNHTIRKVTPAGEVTTLAGVAGSAGSADGTGSAARFNLPPGIAADSDGNLYASDTGNHT